MKRFRFITLKIRSPKFKTEVRKLRFPITIYVTQKGHLLFLHVQNVSIFHYENIELYT